MENFLLETTILFFSAIFSFITCFVVYRKFTVAVWGYIAAFLPRLPITLVALTGGTNLMGFAWFSHTVGILAYPALLAVLDILLLEIALVRLVKPISFVLPKSVQAAIRVESLLNRLQDYNAVPRPVRIQSVYGAGVIAGLITLLFFAGFGLM